MPRARTRAPAVFAALLVVMQGVAGCGRDPGQVAANPSRPRRWEYRFVGANFENLRAAGLDGWEAFAVDRDERGDRLMWLRRPLPDDKP